MAVTGEATAALPECASCNRVSLAGQALDGMLITPTLVGERIGLHPVAVIFAVLAGGQLFGFFGVLLALPAAAVMVVWLRHLHGGLLRSVAAKPARKTRRRT